MYIFKLFLFFNLDYILYRLIYTFQIIPKIPVKKLILKLISNTKLEIILKLI